MVSIEQVKTIAQRIVEETGDSDAISKSELLILRAGFNKLIRELIEKENIEDDGVLEVGYHDSGRRI